MTQPSIEQPEVERSISVCIGLMEASLALNAVAADELFTPRQQERLRNQARQTILDAKCLLGDTLHGLRHPKRTLGVDTHAVAEHYGVVTERGAFVVEDES